MGTTPVIWIVDREPEHRSALARLAAAPDDAPQGSPGDALFREAPAPDAVVLRLAGDLERELEFTHRVGPVARSARWILVGDREHVARARELFDLLPATYLVDPPEPAVLREAIRAAAPGGEAPPLALSQRRARDLVSERFARSLADLDLPTLLRALDPRLAEVPLLVLGERGTGRATLAHYVHHFGGTAGGALLELPCTRETRPEELLDRVAAAHRAPGAGRAVTLWLADPGELSRATQRVASGWIRFGLPPGSVRCQTLRWIATDTGDGLDRELRRDLSGLSVVLPPLREQRERLPHLATAAARAWCRARGVPARRLGEDALGVLEDYPWPGNLRELGAVVEQSLAGSASDPLRREDLILDGEPLEPTARTAPGSRTVRGNAADASTEEVLDLLGEDEPSDGDAPAPAPSDLRKLAAAFGHELRGPLTVMRSFASLLPDRHDDPEFRRSFGDLVTSNVARAGEIAERLEALGNLPTPQPRPVDVVVLLQTVLEQRRQHIRARHLVVLEELDPLRAEARCDPEQLRLALEALLDEVLALVPERGDVYLASRRLEAGLRGGPCIRVLVRYRGRNGHGGETLSEVSPAANALGFAVADLLLRAQNGTLTLDSGERGETLLLLDLPA